MKRFIIIILAILNTSFIVSQDKTKENIGKVEIIEILKEIENSYIKDLDFYERRDAINKVDKIMKLLNGQNDIQPIPSMSVEDFDSFLILVDDYNSPDDQLDFITMQSAYHYFSCYQVSQLVKEIGIGSNQVVVVKRLYNRIIDMENIDIVLDSVFGSSYTKELAEWIFTQ